MSMLSSVAAMPSSSEGASINAKAKRKSRRRRSVTTAGTSVASMTADIFPPAPEAIEFSLTTEKSPAEVEAPRERHRTRRRVHRSERLQTSLGSEVPRENSTTDAPPDDTGSNTTRKLQMPSGHSTASSSRRTTSSSHPRRHATVAAPAPPASSLAKRQQPTVPADVSFGARRSLTSSASAIRPSNRKRLEENQRLAAAGSASRPIGRHRSDHSNNNDLDGALDTRDDLGEEHMTAVAGKVLRAALGKGQVEAIGPEAMAIPRKDEEWFNHTTGSGRNNSNSSNHSRNSAPRVTLTPRSRQYRNLSAGVNKKARAHAAPPAAPGGIEITDRPPSRQRHAFPTHLIDTNAFDAPETTARGGGSSSSSSSSSTSTSGSARSSGRRSSGSSSSLSPPPDGIHGERPPSRYMVKAKRHNQQSHGTESTGSVPSRRGVVDKNCVFSCNQAHHDPKTDGFADMDESVPPPFRIEITTDSNDADDPVVHPTCSSSSSPPLTNVETRCVSQHPRYSLPTRRWSSFSNQEQLLVMAAVETTTGKSEMATAQGPLQWFGKDDQINDAHLFETIISMPSPRPVLEPDVDVEIEDDIEGECDDAAVHASTRNGLGAANFAKPQSETLPANAPAPSRRATSIKATASVVAKPELHWIRSSTNPFFSGASPSLVNYDAMDPETAIEQTPLYSSDDLMTSFVATEMTDLHLDDYTAMGDTTVMPLAPPSTAAAARGGSRLPPSSPSTPLRTSLGQDFLSLFAQH